MFTVIARLKGDSVSETLAAGRSKVSDAKKNDVVVIDASFLSGVKTEGVISMVKQHTISEWGHQVGGV